MKLTVTDNGQIKMELYSCLEQLKPGDLVTTRHYGGDPMVAPVLTNSERPLGVITKIVKIVGKKTRKVKRRVAYVCYQRTVVRTLNYDIHKTYRTNDSIYWLNNQFSPLRSSTDHSPIGFILVPPTAQDAHLTLLFL